MPDNFGAGGTFGGFLAVNGFGGFVLIALSKYWNFCQMQILVPGNCGAGEFWSRKILVPGNLEAGEFLEDVLEEHELVIFRHQNYPREGMFFLGGDLSGSGK